MNPNLNYGLRNFFGYIKDSFKANELVDQIKVKILFIVILLVNGAALILSSSITENLNYGTGLESFTKAFTTLLNKPSIFNGGNETEILNNFQNTFLPFMNVITDLFFLSVLTYLPYFLLSLIMIIYARDLMSHHLPKRTEGLAQTSKLFWKALIIQIIILPFIFFTISGNDFLSFFIFSFLNSIYWFALFSMFDSKDPKAPKFGGGISSAFAFYKKRFFQLLLIISAFQALSSFAIIIIDSISETFNKPVLTASIHAFFISLLQFFMIRFLFHIYKDLKYPQLIKKENEDKNYND